MAKANPSDKFAANDVNGSDDPSGDQAAPVVIKKYANRRLYNTETSAYITLDHLARLTRSGREFVVLDAKTGEDITHSVLTQIIMEAEASGPTMLPSPFLRQLIGMYGGNMAGMVPKYLEASMDAFSKSGAQVREAMTGAVTGTLGGVIGGASPLAEIAKRNMEMFGQAAAVFVPKVPGTMSDRKPAVDDEVAALKAQLAELQAKVDKLAR